MPSDANGVYSLPDGYEAVTGETIQASQHNPPLEDLASAMSLRLMRSGVAPMTGPLKIADGSVGSPGLKFNADGTSGFYKTANGIGVSVGGAKVAEFTSGGISRYLGELIPYTGLTAPSLTVLPYGQTLSRSTYADLWTIAQTEIAGGNTFYNNGDGSTTFGIGDLRGRVVAGKDDMGGVAANRLTSATVVGTTLGAVGGAQTHTLTTTEMPSHNHTGTTATENNSHAHGLPTIGRRLFATGSGGVPGAVPPGEAGADYQVSLGNTGSESATHAHSFTTSNAGTGGEHNNVQPTLVCNYLLYAGA